MPNRLAAETSPYLLQHADNPVDWHPWSDEALALARREGRPILLSVGYSACHWCHVMAHECFENGETAELMNRDFVNVKVDREERPDIDQIYQTAHQLIQRRAGGWPLTMFLTPEGRPFYGGTYFPKRSRQGLPGFDELVQRVAQLWREQRAQIEAQGAEVVRVLQGTLPAPSAGGEARLDSVAARAPADFAAAMLASYDAVHGGFGTAPKFPQPGVLEALLDGAEQGGEQGKGGAAREAVLATLGAMADGGLYDHLGGGFYRYSTDARWDIPHFEKMLYDNGSLLGLCARAWQATGEARWREVCAGTAGWLMREMQLAEGGYASSLDADSEGEEGRHYVWQRDELARVVGSAAYPLVAARYGLDAPPNFERRAWHLRIARPIADIAAEFGLSQTDCEQQIAEARERLLHARASRAAPGRDDKVLASWNALAIEGLLRAARLCSEPAWAESARRALDHLRARLWQGGRLLATSKGDRAHLNAYLDDHAFLIGALIESMQHGALRRPDLAWAVELAEALLARFEDAAAGGFHFTSHDHEALVLRPKSGYDNATPSGNASAALQLQRLGHLVGEPRYLDAARRAMALYAADVQRSPAGFGTLVRAMAEYERPLAIAVVTGPADPAESWHAALARRPGVIALRIAEGEADGEAGLPAALAKPAAPRAQAWICRGTACLPPIREIDAALAALAGARV